MSGFLWEAGLGVGGLRDRSFSLLVFWNIVCFFILTVYTYCLYFIIFFKTCSNSLSTMPSEILCEAACIHALQKPREVRTVPPASQLQQEAAPSGDLGTMAGQHNTCALGGHRLEDRAVTTTEALRDLWGRGLGESVFGEEAEDSASEHSNVRPPPSDYPGQGS